MIRSTVVAGNPFVLCANVLNASGVAITQSTISSITATAYDLDLQVQTWSGSLTVASCVFNTIQSDARSPSYNLAVPIDDSACPTSGDNYRILVTLTPTVGEPFSIEAQIQAC